MMTLRLDEQMEQEIEQASSVLRISKSELIRRSVRNYLDEQIGKMDPWEAGKDLFEQFDSGVQNLSVDRKKIVAEMVAEKFK